MPVARVAALLAAALVMAALAAGCVKQEQHRLCEACIEKDGQMFCGKSDFNLTLDPDSTEEESKLAAGKAACVEFAARKGGGYAGPPYQEALKVCTSAVTAKDLRRVRCEDRVTAKQWHPKDGV